MATPARKLILDDIDTALKTISVAGGFKTDVATVERGWREWSDVGAGEMPWIGRAVVETRPEHLPGRLIRPVMSLTIAAYVNNGETDATEAAISDLHDDIIAALEKDTTRAGNAIQTTWVATRSDEFAPDRIDSQGGVGQVLMDFEVAYLRTTGST